MRLLKILSVSALTIASISSANAAMPEFKNVSGVEVNFDMLDQLSRAQKGQNKLPAKYEPYQSNGKARVQNVAESKAIETAQNQNQAYQNANADIPNYGFVPLAKKWTEPKKTKKEQLNQAKAEDIRVINGSPPPINLWEAVWTTRANFGGSWQKGDGESKRIDFKGHSLAEWENRDRLDFALEIGFESEKDSESRDDRYFITTFDDFISNDMFIRYNGSLENDDMSGIDFRGTAGIGIGHQFIDHPQMNVNFSIGTDFLLEELHEDSDQENDKDFAYSWRFNFEKTAFNEFVTFYHNQRLLVPAERNNDFIFKSHTGARLPLRENFIATLDMDYQIDEGVERGYSETDTKYTFLLGYEW